MAATMVAIHRVLSAFGEISTDFRTDDRDGPGLFVVVNRVVSMMTLLEKRKVLSERKGSRTVCRSLILWKHSGL